MQSEVAQVEQKEEAKVLRTSEATDCEIDQVRSAEIRMRWSMGAQASGDEMELMGKVDIINKW